MIINFFKQKKGGQMKLSFLIFSALLTQSVWASVAGVTEGKASPMTNETTSHRMNNKIGIGTGFGNPFPSIFGLNFGYNATDWLRIDAGFGELSVTSGASSASVKTYGAGADFLLPGWSFSPLGGLHVSSVDVSKSANADISVQGIDKSTTLIYAKAGIDWQSSGGFNFGAGAIAGLSGGSANGSYLSLGWYY